MTGDFSATKQSVIDLLLPVKKDHFIWNVLGAVLAPHVDVLRRPESQEQLDPALAAEIEAQTTPDWFKNLEKKWLPHYRAKSAKPKRKD